MRNAVSRRRWESVDAPNSNSSKISVSGRNEIVVPVSPRLGLADDFDITLRHAAGKFLPMNVLPSRRTSATSHSESALTTETPTPWSPPETL